MNHRQKVKDAIGNLITQRQQLKDFEEKVQNKKMDIEKQTHEVARQIKNVIGVNKKVYLDGHIYQTPNGEDLVITEMEAVILE